jgi:hypothetical protein
MHWLLYNESYTLGYKWFFDFLKDFDYTSYRFGKLNQLWDLFTKYVFRHFL